MSKYDSSIDEVLYRARQRSPERNNESPLKVRLSNTSLPRPDSQGSDSSGSFVRSARGSPLRRTGSPERRQRIADIENSKKRALEDSPQKPKKPRAVSFNNEVHFNTNDTGELKSEEDQGPLRRSVLPPLKPEPQHVKRSSSSSNKVAKPMKDTKDETIGLLERLKKVETTQEQILSRLDRQDQILARVETLQSQITQLQNKRKTN